MLPCPIVPLEHQLGRRVLRVHIDIRKKNFPCAHRHRGAGALKEVLMHPWNEPRLMRNRPKEGTGVCTYPVPRLTITERSRSFRQPIFNPYSFRPSVERNCAALRKIERLIECGGQHVEIPDCTSFIRGNRNENRLRRAGTRLIIMEGQTGDFLWLGTTSAHSSMRSPANG